METLENWLQRAGALSPLDAVGWIIRLSRHLESLHVHGVAHGCVSPACVLIASNSPTARGQVADVRRTAEALQFHSPERLRDGQLSPVDDAWGLAATLYRALTNANPFGQTRQEVMERQQQVLVPITHYGINDNQLLAILAAALIADPRRRTANVATFRMQLEHWSQQPYFRSLPPLEDEESPEDDAAATAMLPMEGMMFEDHPSKFDTSRGTAPALSASPLGEQDATVMRELPAHIIALAARAASGSSPPPPGPPAPEEPHPAEEELGQATRIAPAPDLRGMLGMQGPPGAMPPPAPPPASAPRAPLPPPSAPRQPPPPPAHNKHESHTLASPNAPPPPVSRPRVPRAFKSTQLGVGLTEDTASGKPPSGPREGFAPPPSSVSTHPPPRDPDDVRTVMHQAPVADLLALAQNPGRVTAAPPTPSPVARRMEPTPMVNTQPRVLVGDAREPIDEDDDDGGRTVMRDAPSVAGPGYAPPAPPPPREAQWAPAPPPVQAFRSGDAAPGPFQPTAQTDRPPQPGGPPPAPQRPMPGPPGGGDGGGVSALINETLAAMGPPPNGAMGTPPGGLPQAMPQNGYGAADFMPAGGLGPAPFGVQAQAQHGTSAVFPSPAGAGMGGPPGGGPLQPAGLGASGMQGVGMPMGMPNTGSPGMGSMGIEPLAPPPFAAPQATPPAGPASGSSGGSRVMLVIVCLLVLILAAAVTFLALKFRAQLGF